jgi:hypothetical protein
MVCHYEKLLLLGTHSFEVLLNERLDGCCLSHDGYEPRLRLRQFR